MVTEADSTPSKKQHRDALRERVRAERLRELKEKKRRRILKGVLLSSIPIVVLIIIVALIVTRPNAAVGPAPDAANKQGGITLTSPTEFADGAAIGDVDLSTVKDGPGDDSTPPPGVAKSAKGDPAQVVIYADANCVHCADFDTKYRDLLRKSLDNGSITLEYRFVNFLATESSTQYSTRAANAAACVADTKPAAYLDFVEGLYNAYGSEPSDEQLEAMAKDAGADIASCQKDNTYKTFVRYTSSSAISDGVKGTPSVWVNGKSWKDSDQDFPTFLSEASDS